MAYAWDGRPRADRRERIGAIAPPLPHVHDVVRLGVRPSARGAISASPEIDCLRHRLPPRLLIDAEHRAAALGVGADEVLLCAGALSGEHYARELASYLHLRFDSLETVPREWCPLPDERLVDAITAGVLLLRVQGREIFVVAPRGLKARRTVAYLAGRSDRSQNVWLTSPECLSRFVRRHAYETLATRAANGLKAQQPAFSAAPRRWRSFFTMIAAMVGGIAIVATAGEHIIVATQLAVTALFLGWSGLRLFGLLNERARVPRLRRPSDAALPVYTVIIALYREAEALPGLVETLRLLDYPPEKLDVKIVLEADDTDTFKVARAMQLGPPIEILIAPPSGPRTKPKALNAALPFARGEYTAVYDAEDRPEPDQLLRALATFAAGDAQLACVQARLTIDNTRDGWLTRLFTAEYAGLFDVLLPALCSFGLPIPLGGSSNHFKTEALREVGAWDPYNVTEDADLGIRLARRGYRSSMVASTTYEEAPADIWPWLKQRTRWFKGWIQTWCVHMRRPWRLWSEVGACGFFALQFMLFGTVLAALLHPLGLAMMLAWTITGSPLFGDEMIGWAHAAALVSGYTVSAALGIVGLKRRRLLSSAWGLLLMPAHWLLLSAAAWRALFQFCFDRYSWEKTDHGKARTSRRPLHKRSQTQ